MKGYVVLRRTSQDATFSLSFKSIDSPLGKLLLVAQENALLQVLFAHQVESFFICSGKKARPSSRHPILNESHHQLNAYFKGKRQLFLLPTLLKGTEFQQRVWKTLCQIPYGKTVAYQTLAGFLGDPDKARAVGSALGKNPLPIVYPCHRVLSKNGQLGGFAGGKTVKQWLLALENDPTSWGH